jgi:hypothetical protein
LPHHRTGPAAGGRKHHAAERAGLGSTLGCW